MSASRDIAEGAQHDLADYLAASIRDEPEGDYSTLMIGLAITSALLALLDAFENGALTVNAYTMQP